jgi:hypothetical protein
VKVRGIFDSSQRSRKQKPQPDRIRTEVAVPIGDTNIQAECSAGVNLLSEAISVLLKSPKVRFQQPKYPLSIPGVHAGCS